MIVREVATGKLNMGSDKDGGSDLLIWCAVFK